MTASAQGTFVIPAVYAYRRLETTPEKNAYRERMYAAMVKQSKDVYCCAVAPQTFYLCTRPKGHEAGVHWAEYPQRCIVAAWDEDGFPLLPRDAVTTMTVGAMRALIAGLSDDQRIYVNQGRSECDCYGDIRSSGEETWHFAYGGPAPVLILNAHAEPGNLRVEEIDDACMAVCEDCERPVRRATDEEIADAAEARWEASR